MHTDDAKLLKFDERPDVRYLASVLVFAAAPINLGFLVSRIWCPVAHVMVDSDYHKKLNASLKKRYV
jgi:hypothetical protein